MGETTDHPLVNPFGPNSPNLEKVDLSPILVIVGSCDLLRDRALDYANKLKKWGKSIEYVEFEGQQHGFFTINPDSEPSQQLMLLIKKFIVENSIWFFRLRFFDTFFLKLACLFVYEFVCILDFRFQIEIMFGFRNENDCTVFTIRFDNKRGTHSLKKKHVCVNQPT